MPDASNNILRKTKLEDSTSYKTVLQINESLFEYLLEKVAPQLSKEDTAVREALPFWIKLGIVLRYAATGRQECSLF